ncbi:MAG: hypothetical protein JWM86_956 [Thermoleophilia bacterium]|nr:hypothetical protein [Thermoleophilia bacterium]
MLSATDIASLIAVLVMAACVPYAARFEFLARDTRTWWMSLASGVTVGYVFLGLLPKVIDSEKKVRDAAKGVLPLLEDHVLFIALLGMLVFYAIALARHRAAVRDRETGGDEPSGGTVTLFWTSVASYVGYMFLIGYVVQDAGEQDAIRMLVLAGILAIHFMTTDFGLGHGRVSTPGPASIGRMLLAVALLVGWAVGSALELDRSSVAIASSFLAGAILLTVLSDELPSERDAKFLPFAGGSIASGLLLATIG